VAYYGLPGMAGAVIHRGTIQTAVSGVRQAGAPGRAAPGDLWHLGSNTKAITATLAGLLVAEGKLRWDSTPAQAFPDLASRMRPELAQVTLRQLLEHRAGIPPYTSDSEFDPLPALGGSPRQQRRAFAAYVLAQPPGGKAGHYLYSNAGYGIAAALLEEAADESYEDLLRERLLQPLGIKGTFGWPAGTDPAQPWGHYQEHGKYAPHDPHDDYQIPACIAPAADLSLSIGDYARFVQLHLRGLEGLTPAPGKAVLPRLKAAVIQDLHSADGDYSCGWGEQSFDGAPDSVHEGSTGTFHAIVLIIPERDVAVAVVTNAGGPADDPAGGNAEAAVRAVAFKLAEGE
jgi:CubicO group peptidase (beta-lactamase class C family)